MHKHDRDRYLTTLFAPADKRDALLALYAFDVEIRRIPDIVSDPMPGEVRLQWWLDMIRFVDHGAVEGHPVAAELRRIMELYNLPQDPFLDLIEAHTFDLYNDPMPLLTDLEGYAGETVSAIMQLASIVLADGREPGTADVAGHAGVALGITNVLTGLPWHTARRQVFLPADVLGRHGMCSEEVLDPEGSDRLLAVVREL
ncbi:MAG: phytoene/squalene synthase family protein, partial [Pseudomonadota bacterium]